MSKSDWGVIVSIIFALATAAGLPFVMPQPWRHAISVVAFTVLTFALLGWAIAHIKWLSRLRATQYISVMILLIVFVVTGAAGTGLFLLTRPSEDASVKRRQFSEMTNAELSDATMKFVDRLRKFNSDFRRTDDALTIKDWFDFQAIVEKMPDSEKEKPGVQQRLKEIQNEVVVRIASRLGKFEDSFQANYLVDAQLLDKELRKRVNIKALITDPGSGTILKGRIIALDGKLAGPDPIGDLANYLDSLGKQLRQDQ